MRVIVLRVPIMWLPINKKNQKGFTLIELIVVIVLITVLVGIAIPSFLTFNNSQALQTAALGVETTLQQAKSEAESEVNPCKSFPLSLTGYQVSITSATTYELDVVCTNTSTNTRTTTKVSSQILPSGTKFGSSSQTFLFNVLQGGVTSTSNTIVIKGLSGTQTVTIDQLGNIVIPTPGS